MSFVLNSFILGVFFLLPVIGFAAGPERLSLTITPPLFQVALDPGYVWSSTVKVVNSNPFPLELSVDTLNFRSDAETGNASFIPMAPGSAPTGLASWIALPDRTITVPPDATLDIPFRITVPNDAPPGGHYAAIMIGNNPERTAGFAVGSLMTSLLFVRVSGEVIEAGDIRDFYVADEFLENADGEFVLRFENTGNVHIIPRGDIVISNMWGKERGTVVVNEETAFGNVLPGATRRFAFRWKGEGSVFDIGRYKAVATLTYGDVMKKTVFRTTYFWILPWRPVVFGGLGIIVFVWFVQFAIRRYIRRVIALERAHYGGHERAEERNPVRAAVRPITVGGAALRAAYRGEVRPTTTQTHVRRGHRSHFWHTVREYRLFFIALFVCIGTVVLVGWYFVEVFRAERAFNIEVQRPDRIVAPR